MCFTRPPFWQQTLNTRGVMEEDTNKVVQQVSKQQYIAVTGKDREHQVAEFLDSIFPAIKGHSRSDISSCAVALRCAAL